MGRALYVVFISSHVGGEQGVNSPHLFLAQKNTRSRKAFARQQAAMRDRWLYVEQRLEKLIPDFSSAVLYQDAVCIAAPERVMQHFACLLADYPKSPNFLLLKNLIDRGARLLGVDDLELVVRHLANMQRLSRATEEDIRKNWVELLTIKAEEEDLVMERNQSIADEIVRTLPVDGIGILFLGRDHHPILDRLEAEFGKGRVHVIVR